VKLSERDPGLISRLRVEASRAEHVGGGWGRGDPQYVGGLFSRNRWKGYSRYVLISAGPPIFLPNRREVERSLDEEFFGADLLA